MTSPQRSCVTRAAAAVTALLSVGVHDMPAAEPYQARHECQGVVIRIAGGRHEAASIGSYDIRAYDGDEMVFLAGLVMPRDGEIVHSWVTADPGGDGVWIWVWTACVGTGRFGTVDVFRLVRQTLVPCEIPEPPRALMAGYRGHDEFEVGNGVLYRQFPLYRDGDANAEPTDGTRCLEFDTRAGAWHLSNRKIASHEATQSAAPEQEDVP